MQEKNIESQYLLNNLGLPPIQKSSFMRDSRDVLIRTINQVLAIVHSQTKSEGPDGFATLFLASRSINDLNCAFHLAQHGYMSQSYSLIRNVVESLDLMDLFHRNPKEADDWADEYSKELEKKFRPGAVRSRLGKPSVDPLYNMLCGHGNHPRFEGRHLSSGLLIDEKSGKKKLVFSIGGRHTVKDLYQTHFYIILLAQHLLIAVWQHFGDKIPEKISGEAFLTLENTAQFLETHIPKMAKAILNEDGQSNADKLIKELKVVFAGIAPLGKELARKKT